MTKKELIDQIVEKTDLNKKDIRFIFDQILQGIEEALAAGESVRISGFGAFERRIRHERKGRNPNTGETIILKNHFAPSFRPGKRLKEKIFRETLDNYKISC